MALCCSKPRSGKGVLNNVEMNIGESESAGVFFIVTINFKGGGGTGLISDISCFVSYIH